MSKPLPTFTEAGWLTGLTEKMDKLLAYFFTNQRSQSNLYEGGVASLQYLVRTYQNNPDEMASQAGTTLTTMLRPWFDECSAVASVENRRPSGRYDLVMSIRATQGNKVFSVEKLAEIENGGVNKIIEINNG